MRSDLQISDSFLPEFSGTVSGHICANENRAHTHPVSKEGALAQPQAQYEKYIFDRRMTYFLCPEKLFVFFCLYHCRGLFTSGPAAETEPEIT